MSQPLISKAIHKNKPHENKMKKKKKKTENVGKSIFTVHSILIRNRWEKGTKYIKGEKYMY